MKNKLEGIMNEIVNKYVGKYVKDWYSRGFRGILISGHVEMDGSIYKLCIVATDLEAKITNKYSIFRVGETWLSGFDNAVLTQTLDEVFIVFKRSTDNFEMGYGLFQISDNIEDI